ncbi:tyrosine-type recombinase/integrase [Candidatus Dependentiae bacterium]|nr:tyrosine-type recombinase/integrase [Candidatus Dependentiae bacterium]
MKNNVNYLTHFEMFLLAEKRVAQNTFVAYQRDIKQFMDFLRANRLSLKRCAKPQLKRFLRILKTSGATAKTISRKISSLKLFFSFLHDRFEFENKATSLVFPKTEKKLPVYLTEQELQLLFDAANKDNSYRGIRNKVMLSLIYASGMRVTELVSTKLEQIHFDTGFVSIMGKGSKERMVPLPQNVLVLLRFYIDTVYEKLLPKKIALGKKEYLFPVSYKKQIKAISRQQFWSLLKQMITQSEIKKNISPHSLRHSLATHLLKKGANIRLLQVLLGHEQLTTVQVYTHLQDSHLRKEYDKKHPRA